MNLKNSQYQAIMRNYDRIQAMHRNEQTRRHQEIIGRFPEYDQLEKDIAESYASIIRARVLGQPTPEGASLCTQTAPQRQKEILLKAGYPSDYLDLHYTCPDCKDTGMIGEEKCHCFKQAMVDLLYQQTGIYEILKKENFSSFRLDYYSEVPDRRLGISPRQNMAEIVDICLEFIRDFDHSHGNLLIRGNTGVGKTFLTNCIASDLLNQSRTVIYLTAPALVDILANNTFGKDEEDDYPAENMYDYIRDCDLLIIDDLGTELNNSFVTSELYVCINDRLLTQKSTVISTNLSLQEIQNAYSERVFSRLISNYQVLEIIGEDIRIKKAISGD